MKKAVFFTLLFLLIFPSFVSAQSTPSAVVSGSLKQATAGGLLNEKFNQSARGFLNVAKTILQRLEKINQRISTRITKLGQTSTASDSAQMKKIESQQKIIVSSLEQLKSDLVQLEAQLQSFAASSLTKSDMVLFKKELKNYNTKLKQLHKLELNLIFEMKKMKTATEAPKLKAIPLQ